jgi:peroxiredoxin
MKRKGTRIIPFLIFITIIGFVTACSATEASAPEKKAEKTPSEVLTFETTDLAINPAEINPGVEVIITAQVVNTGDTEGIYTAGLVIDDATTATTEVALAAGASQLVSFTGSVATPGNYKVTWAELVGKFLVPRLTGEFIVVGDDPPEFSDVNIKAPDFTAVDVVTGETISLDQFSGAPVLLNFVNYGCSPELNQVVSAQLLAIRDLKEERDDFVSISVFCGCCPEDLLREFAEENELEWPWILDTDYSIVNKYASYLMEYGYPTLILIDKERYIREVTGYNDVNSLMAKIDEVIK